MEDFYFFKKARMENDLDREINVVGNNNTANDDDETKLKIFFEEIREIPSGEYRPGLSELKENGIICTIGDKDIRLNDFINGSKELGDAVIQEFKNKVNKMKKEKEEKKVKTIVAIIEALKTKKENESL